MASTLKTYNVSVTEAIVILLASDNEKSDPSDIISSLEEDARSLFDEQESEGEIEWKQENFLFYSFRQTDSVWSLPFMQNSNSFT